MIDTILVGFIVAIAAFFVGRKLYRQFTAKTPFCGCSGCGQNSCCSSKGNCSDFSSCDKLQ
ncbi:FeoB-associated Cys-rich membrane protein [uncultured Pseudodesulfovibrio sp.]|uniref:FeoB-associated Cys-rich membrane protein n=1 Tax=uncultured Pseudodesulfovibrio sp. TaxID=2035858 RepID=UPI0029C7B0B2|nr:FeoB-associated Cys-rich membrane protein [uncultured Pseudodesulfovibrio sp.]